MKRNLDALLGATALAAALTAALALAQSPGTVTVGLSDLRADIARDMNVDETKIPVTVEVPVSVAEQVCNAEPGTLTPNALGHGVTCRATRLHATLDPYVERAMASKQDESGKGSNRGNVNVGNAGASLAPASPAHAEAKASGEGNATGPTGSVSSTRPGASSGTSSGASAGGTSTGSNPATPK